MQTETLSKEGRKNTIQQDAWKEFMRTGSVRSYLAYRGYSNQKGWENSYASIHGRADR